MTEILFQLIRILKFAYTGFIKVRTMLGSCCQATCTGSLKCRVRSVYTTAPARSHSSLYTLGAGITTLRRQLNHTIIAKPRPRPACSSILSDFMVLSVSNFKMAHRSSRSILSRSYHTECLLYFQAAMFPIRNIYQLIRLAHNN